MFTRSFWIDTAERVLRTFAQGFIATMGASALNVFNASWLVPLGISAGMAFISLCMCIVAGPVGGNPNTASLLPNEPGRIERWEP